ncbi:glycoside hydrolase family 108 protein [Tateyamaria sp.]|uniref:glycoside hydrolase family 108 protein n=1 Tax=Tateyamaria sp. TaxID=1929288 RepID=UPI003B21B2A2
MDRFERAFALLAVHEGGYVNHPDDPGGATNRGVTQRTYDDYRCRHGIAIRDVRSITDDEVATIYRNQYWDAVRADDLPGGVAYCVFDAAVNSGPGRAARWLQSGIGASVDGSVGNETVGLAASVDPLRLIDGYCDRRLAFMKRLRHWPTFKNGWSRRVAEVRAQSKAWAANGTTQPSQVAQPAKADGPESAAATLRDTLTDGKSVGTIAGIVGSAGALLSGHGPVQYAIAAVLVLGALVGVWWLVKGRNA